MAKFSIFLAIFTILATLTSATSAAEAKKKKKKSKCAKGAHIIGVRGHPKHPRMGLQGFGITTPLRNAIRRAIPGSDAYALKYPKGGTVNSENQAGTSNEQKAIADYVKKCPDTPIILMGFSEGATITMNTICGTSNPRLSNTPALSEDYTSNIIAIIAYSDAGHIPFQSFNKGTCGALPGLFPRANPASCNPYADRIQSYCDKKDDYCCTFKGQNQEHYQYFDLYDHDVAKFVKKQYKKYKRGKFAKA